MARRKKSEAIIIQESRPYVLWRRVSTVKQGSDGLGIAAQLSIAQTFMGRDPIEVFTDVYSGTKLKQCKGLWQAIELCKQKDYVLVIPKVDRCRNVQEALDIVDAIGTRNLIFCDAPSSDRFVLTILFAVYERQALMGRINTRIALAERKKQIAKDGCFLSKSGRLCDHLGRQKGDKNPNAVSAMNNAVTAQRLEWRKTSPLYSWVTIQVLKGRPRKEILEEAERLYEENPKVYCTREGCKLSKGVLSRWIREILKKV